MTFSSEFTTTRGGTRADERVDVRRGAGVLLRFLALGEVDAQSVQIVVQGVAH